MLCLPTEVFVLVAVVLNLRMSGHGTTATRHKLVTFEASRKWEQRYIFCEKIVEKCNKID